MYQGTAVASDSDTKSVLYDWLQFREINDENEDKFLVYYRRNLDMFYPKYLLLLEDELKDIPQLDNFRSEITGQLRNYGSITDEIVRTIERENQRTDDLTRTTDMARKDTGTVGNSQTDVLTGSTRNDDQLNQNVTGSSNSQSYDSSSSSSSGTADSTGSVNTKGMIRDLPQSIEYAGGGFPNNLDWTTGTNQAEDISNTTSHGTNDSSSNSSSNGETESSNTVVTINTGYTTGSSNQTNTYNSTQTNNLTSSDEGTIKDTGTQTTNEGVDENASNTRRLDDKHDTFSTEHGFKGMTEAEIRLKIWDYISNSIALQWFLGKMERCFIGVFE